MALLGCCEIFHWQKFQWTLRNRLLLPPYSTVLTLMLLALVWAAGRAHWIWGLMTKLTTYMALSFIWYFWFWGAKASPFSLDLWFLLMRSPLS